MISNGFIYLSFSCQNGNDYKEPYYPLQYVKAQVSHLSCFLLLTLSQKDVN